MVRVALLNDTDKDGHHFGCARVMGGIRQALANRGMSVELAVPSAVEWAKSESLIKGLASVDLILINGEGTLHHGRPKAKWLLDVADHPALKDVPKAVVNMLWQDNPPEWGTLLGRFDLAQARDSKSAAEAARMSGLEISSFADYSVCWPLPPMANAERQGIVVGDSVSGRMSAHLADFAIRLRNEKQAPVQFVPVITEASTQERHKKLSTRVRFFLADLRLRLKTKGRHQVHWVDDVDAYIAKLSASELSVTGRFHSVCLSIATRTPFLAMTSNSRKIEALMEDCGLSRDRIVAPDQLTTALVTSRSWDYSDEELSNIDAYLTKGAEGLETTFDRLKTLAEARQ